jgi:hypothetical protein
MLKTYMKNTSILHVKDFDEGRNELLADVLLGEVITDETKRYIQGESVLTSPIACSNNNEFKTESGSFYITEGHTFNLTISTKEWAVIKENAQYLHDHVLQTNQYN